MLILFELLLDHTTAGLIESEHLNLLDDLKFLLAEVTGVGYLYRRHW